MSWPYVAQDGHGGWYADCEGVMQDSDPSRTQLEAMQWCIDRLAHKLGQTRHGCEYLIPSCLLHQETFDDETIVQMCQQINTYPVSFQQDGTVGKIVLWYEQWINQKLKEAQ